MKHLQTAAEARGEELETYAARLLESSAALTNLSFRELLAPLHRQVAESGMSDGEVDRLLDETIAESRRTRNSRP